MNDRLYRSATDRVFSGLCGGMAEHFDLDSSLVRLAWVVLDVLTGIFPLLVVYVIMAMVVPEEPPEGAPPWQGWGPLWGAGTPGAPGSAAPGWGPAGTAPNAGSGAGAWAAGPATDAAGAAGTTGDETTADASGATTGAGAAAPTTGTATAGADAGQSQASGTWGGWGAPPPPAADWRATRAYWRDQRRAQRAYWRSQRRGGDGSTAGLVFGVILVVVGGLFLLHEAAPSFDTSLIWPAILIVFGAALLAGAFRR